MSFISDYLLATDGNESPRAFHLWSCLSVLSAAAGRRFWFKLGRIQYHPHLYVLLVADPGVKKSTAMDFAKDLIRETKICPLAASQATKEFFGKAMSHEKFAGKRFFTHNNEQIEYNQYAVFATEFTQFIAVNPEGMLEFFTAIYTEKVHSVDTKNQGSDYVIGPYFTILGCLTPHMLKGYLKMNVLTGGFARRTVFVYGLRERIIPIPEEVDPAIIQRLHAWILMLQSKQGEFVFGPGGEEWFRNWYINLQTNIKTISKPNTESYYLTKQELLFKAAMLIVLSETNGDGREIGPADFEFAEKVFFAPVEKYLDRVFEGTGVNPNSNVAIQVCRMLEGLRNPINKKQLAIMFGDQATSWKDLQDTLAHLVMGGKLEERSFSGTVSGKSFTGTLVGTPEAFAGKSNDELVQYLQLPVPQRENHTDSGTDTRPEQQP